MFPPKTWNIICQMKFFVLFLPFFWSDMNGYDNLVLTYIYIHIHTQDSRYITYPKNCVTDHGKGVFHDDVSASYPTLKSHESLL